VLGVVDAMARPPRLSFPGIALHIVQRGVDRQPCFREDSDYLVYLTFLGDLTVRTQCALHAYCLMTNHVHLLLTPAGEHSCAKLMRELGQRYVPYFNRRYGRTGTLWEGRFRSCLVDSARYVLVCHRYIELNPVRAGMVAAPPAYRWSSHAGNIGVQGNRLLTPHSEYLALGADLAYRQAAYRALFEQGDEPSFVDAVRDATNGGYALVGEELKAKLAQAGVRHLERVKPGPPRAKVTQDPIAHDMGLQGELLP